ncbi:hypothetical protein C6I20_14440 [Aeromicrobium sp. A1-2]|nr:hypothetical protein C6I20_14440 [Aeromicrobium sp. A1-2]
MSVVGVGVELVVIAHPEGATAVAVPVDRSMSKRVLRRTVHPAMTTGACRFGMDAMEYTVRDEGNAVLGL